MPSEHPALSLTNNVNRMLSHVSASVQTSKSLLHQSSLSYHLGGTATTALASHIATMERSAKRQSQSPACVLAVADVVSLWSNCSDIGDRLDLGANASSAAVGEWCDSSCSVDLASSITGVVNNCDLGEEDLADAETWLATVRDVTEVLCVRDSADNLCFDNWVHFAEDVTAAEAQAAGVARNAAFSGLADAHCSECLDIFFKRSTEFATKREGESDEDFAERVKDAVALKLLCMQGDVPDESGTRPYCMNEVSSLLVGIEEAQASVDEAVAAIEADPSLSEGEKNVESLRAYNSFIEYLFEEFCSPTNCVQRFVYAHRYYTGDGEADAFDSLTSMRAACTRPSLEEPLCIVSGYGALFDFLEDLNKDPADRPACTALDGNEASCAADSCKASVSKHFDLGCCIKPFFNLTVTLDEDSDDFNYEEAHREAQDWVEFIGNSCGVDVPAPCERATINVSVEIDNIEAGHLSTSKQEILAAVRADFCAQAGCDADSLTAEVDEAATGKRADGRTVFSLSTDASYSPEHATAFSSIFLSSSRDEAAYTNKEVSQATPDSSRVDPLAPFATAKAGETVVTVEAGVDPFSDADVGQSSTFSPVSTTALVLALTTLAAL